MKNYLVKKVGQRQHNFALWMEHLTNVGASGRITGNKRRLREFGTLSSIGHGRGLGDLSLQCNG
jgi:hypothetical protein